MADVQPVAKRPHAEIHDLKILPQWFAAVDAGTKRWEVRKDDRGFAEGDILALREWDPDQQGDHYTGRLTLAKVLSVWRDVPHVEAGYVLMDIARAYIEVTPRAAAHQGGRDQ